MTWQMHCFEKKLEPNLPLSSYLQFPNSKKIYLIMSFRTVFFTDAYLRVETENRRTWFCYRRDMS
jgi:hypothetical protein